MKTKPRARKLRKPMKVNEVNGVPLYDVSGSMMNLHHELGTGSTEDGRKMRFCQHVNGGCFWLSVGEKMYQLDTADLMHFVCKAALAHETRTGVGNVEG